MKTVHIILWKYSDRSGFGVVRAYADQGIAEDDLEMLQEHCTEKSFELQEVMYNDALEQSK